MKTVEEYKQNNFPVIPCYANDRKPIGKEWEEGKHDFEPGNNIGLHLLEHIDIDVDNPVCHKFLKIIKTKGCAIYGRKSNPESHLLFKGQLEYKKFLMHESFKPYFSKYRKGKTILEIRSGKGFQSIAPGSVLENEEVRWDNYIEPKEYPGDLEKDIKLVVFATMLSIIYPSKGSCDDFCYSVACLLMKWGKWSEDKIDQFILELAHHSGDHETRKNFGRKAYKENTQKGLPTLMEIAAVPGEAIKHLFEVIDIKIGKEDQEQKEKKITKLNMYDWSEYLNLDIPEPKFVVERLFKTKSINFISGPKGNGKTEWTLGLTDVLSKGGKFLNYTVDEPYPVIYIDGEMDEYDLIERRTAYTQNQGPQKHYFNIIHYAQQQDQTIPDIKFEHGQDLILKEIQSVKEKTGKTPVLVLDNLRSLSNYRENESDDWRPIGVWLKNLRALDVVSIVIDHHGKGDNAGPRGSSSKTDWANVSIFIKSVSKGRTKGTMRMEIKFDKARGLRPDETQDYECEYNFNGGWEVVASEQKVSEEEYLEKIYQIKSAGHREYLKKKEKLDKDLDKGKITEKIYNQLIKSISKTTNKSQAEIGVELGISAGKVNKLMKGPYEQYFIKKVNEEYKLKEENKGLKNE